MKAETLNSVCQRWDTHMGDSKLTLPIGLLSMPVGLAVIGTAAYVGVVWSVTEDVVSIAKKALP